MEPLYYLGYEIKTLSSYTTPYYYADGPSPIGSLHHYQTIRQLKGYMNRQVKAGALKARETVKCAQCGQHITDGKPCGCGAR